jgi:hypothetical protein
VRSALKRQQGGKYAGKVQQRQKRKQHRSDNPLLRSELDGVFHGGEDSE